MRKIYLSGILILVFCLVIAIAFIGCGGTKSDSSNNSDKKEIPQGTILFQDDFETGT